MLVIALALVGMAAANNLLDYTLYTVIWEGSKPVQFEAKVGLTRIEHPIEEEPITVRLVGHPPRAVVSFWAPPDTLLWVRYYDDVDPKLTATVYEFFKVCARSEAKTLICVPLSRRYENLKPRILFFPYF